MKTPLTRCLATLAIITTVAPAAPPTIVVLFSDDAGYADFGFQAKADPPGRPILPHLFPSSYH